jgi:hypothetical protein
MLKLVESRNKDHSTQLFLLATTQETMETLVELITRPALTMQMKKIKLN